MGQIKSMEEQAHDFASYRRDRETQTKEYDLLWDGFRDGYLSAKENFNKELIEINSADNAQALLQKILDVLYRDTPKEQRPSFVTDWNDPLRKITIAAMFMYSAQQYKSL